jgi:uncharacterized protein (TIGR00296 family)
MVLLTEKQGKALLRLAREVIQAHLSGGSAPRLPADDIYQEKRGVFCTLKTRLDVLRGCIGYPYPTNPLGEALADAAIQAAVGDPRFKPVEADELADIKIEVTVLTKPEPLTGKREDYPKKITIGRHGLIVKSPLTSGLLLPQVAVENGEWSPTEFLEATCWKAGLPPHAWKEANTQVLTFEGQIFTED